MIKSSVRQSWYIKGNLRFCSNRLLGKFSSRNLDRQVVRSWFPTSRLCHDASPCDVGRHEADDGGERSKDGRSRSQKLQGDQTVGYISDAFPKEASLFSNLYMQVEVYGYSMSNLNQP
jgi:hypothetical protein